MTRVLFISDLHLHGSRPHVTEFFMRFLERSAREADRLFILGDLFEAWIGDDDQDTHSQRVVDALRSYTDSGRRCSFIRGNRDFLIGPMFAAATGVELLEEPAVEEIFGQRVLLLHGDALCTDDHEYQAYRRRARNPTLQAIFLAMPAGVRRVIAAHARRRSQIRTAGKADYIMDVSRQAVSSALRRHHVRLLVHGHTHRPAVHRFELDGAPATRIVLGDWYQQGSALSWSAAGYELHTLPFHGKAP